MTGERRGGGLAPDPPPRPWDLREGGELPIKVVVLGNHSGTGYSMRRYSDLLVSAYRDGGVLAQAMSPSDAMSKHTSARVARKLLEYVEGLVLFPLRAAWRTRRVDAVHISDHSNALWLVLAPFRGVTIVTVHDLIAVRAARGELAEHRPRLGGRIYQRAVESGLGRATRVVAVSEATARDVRRIIPGAAVTVIHNPVDAAFEPGRGRQGDLMDHLNPPVALVVSTSSWRKRREHAIAMWQRLRTTGRFRELRLQLVGPPLSEAEKSVLNPSEHDLIEVVARVTEDDLVRRYQAADVLIQGSKYEGFGWPIVEAHACGTVALCDDQPLFREVGGRGAVYVGEDLTRVDWEAVARELDSDGLRAAACANAERFRYSDFVPPLVDHLVAEA